MASQETKAWLRPAGFWWVPILVLILSGFGFLIREFISQSREPGTLVLLPEEHPPNVSVVIQLDNREPVFVNGGFA